MNKLRLFLLSIVFSCMGIQHVSGAESMSPEEAVRSLEKPATAQQGYRALNRSGKEAVPVLMKAAFDSNAQPNIRTISLLQLSRLKAHQAQKPLESMLKSDKDESLRMISAVTLGDLQDSSSKEPLKKAFNDDKSPKVKLAAAWALARLGDNSGKSLAIKSVNDPKDTSGHDRAITVLEELAVHGDKSVIPVLKKCASSKDDLFMGIMARVALRRIDFEKLPSVEEKIQYLDSLLQNEPEHEIQQWATRRLADLYENGNVQALETLKKIAGSEAMGAAAAKQQLAIMVSEEKITTADLNP